ncbi:hypothetical protein, partial [Prauserella rugosa]|uniref:hypothetical protein n=1 Tax=Prauserella rugosa TaxID=43354 RepID=UPI001B809794
MRFAVGVFRLAGWAGLWDGVSPLRTIPFGLGFLFITLQAGRKGGFRAFRWGGLLRPACSVMGFGQVDGMALRLPGATLLG